MFLKLRHVQHVLNRPRNTDDALAKRQLAFDLMSVGLADHSHRSDLKRWVDGWYVHKSFAVFLSHFKFEAAAEARVLKLELVKRLRCKEEQVFLDADNLNDLRKLLDHVVDSDCVALLWTQGILSRPWCLLELQAAVVSKVPIVLISVANAFEGDLEAIGAILEDLPAHFAAPNPKDSGNPYNPTAEATLRELGCDPLRLGREIKAPLLRAPVVTFNPHQSIAMLRAQISQMAAAFVEGACPQNEALLAGE